MTRFVIGEYVEPEFKRLLHSIDERLLELEGIKDIDPFEKARIYNTSLSIADQSVDPNANIQGKSPVNQHSEMYKSLDRLRGYYLMWEYTSKRYNPEFASQCIKACLDGTLYINDLKMIDIPYCFAMDTTPLLFEGQPYCNPISKPPKHMLSYLMVLIDVINDMSLEFAGAIGMSNALVNLAYFTKELPDKDVENACQSLIYGATRNTRPTGDSAFTNISLFDRELLKNTFSEGVYPDYSKMVDNIEEIMRVQKIFATYFAEGQPDSGLPFPFPVVTVCVYIDGQNKIVDNEFFEYMVDLNRRDGMFNWHAGDKLASCCRLTSDLNELKKHVRVDAFGNGGISVGSHRVVTINLHRIALLAQTEGASFFEELSTATNMVVALLDVHKNEVLSRRIKAGLLQFFDVKWCVPEMFFSTIGFTGLYDSYMLQASKYDRADYVKYAQRVLGALELAATNATRDHPGLVFNVEETPAENMAVKFAAKDKILYDSELDILSNQMLPLYEKFDILERIEVASELMNDISGGAILHLNIEDNMSVGANQKLTRLMIEKFKIPHFAFNRGWTVCVNEHTTPGILQKCPTCGGEIDTHVTRVVGFFTRTKDWIRERRTEFGNRQFYKMTE